MSPGMVSLLKDGPRAGHLLHLPRPHRARAARGVPRGRVVRRTASSTSRPTSSATSTPSGPTWSASSGSSAWPARSPRSATSRPRTSPPTLPAASRLLDVLGLHEPDAGSLVRRWQGKGRTTKAVIGESTDGPFQIDIRADGPHGLVAGTTGSGKSELLQTLIASLAVGNRPDEFNFVLVDYKGGAAFKDCNHLPHTVGMVTDLDGHLTTRALESLGAELRRREHQLADADAKDIEDYLAGRQPGDEPMPRLLIVIDEFAALAAELPDFVTGLVDVARRGRSLGVHLILATQRPAGVVSAEIKSNTNLRIALRVTDAGDSDDVIESSAAAQIPKVFPGRAYARLGHSSLIPFQSSRVGGRPGGGAGGSVRIADMDWRRPAAARPLRRARRRRRGRRQHPDRPGHPGRCDHRRQRRARPARDAQALAAAAPGDARRRLARTGLEQRRERAQSRPDPSPSPSASPTSPAQQQQVVETWDLVGRLAPDDRRAVTVGPQQLPARARRRDRAAVLARGRAPLRHRRRQQRPAAADVAAPRRRGGDAHPDRPDVPPDRLPPEGARRAAAVAGRARVRRHRRAAIRGPGRRADALSRRTPGPVGGLRPGLRVRRRRRTPRPDHRAPPGGRRRRHPDGDDRRTAAAWSDASAPWSRTGSRSR